MPIPAELGGGAGILTTVLVMEALGYGCHDNGLLFSLNAQLWSLELPLVKFGTPAQQQAYLPGLIPGDLVGVHAMTEPDSGSDAFSMRTREAARLLIYQTAWLGQRGKSVLAEAAAAKLFTSEAWIQSRRQGVRQRSRWPTHRVDGGRAGSALG